MAIIPALATLGRRAPSCSHTCRAPRVSARTRDVPDRLPGGQRAQAMGRLHQAEDLAPVAVFDNAAAASHRQPQSRPAARILETEDRFAVLDAKHGARL